MTLRFLASSCLLFSLASFHTALASDGASMAVSKLGDTTMSCGALSEEAASMRDIVFATQSVKDKSKMRSRSIGVAGAAASALIGTATGGIGLAAVGFLVDNEISNSASKADEMQDIAGQRRSLMMGIYNAKGCHGPLDHAMQNPKDVDPIVRSLASLNRPEAKYHAELRKPYNQ